MSKTLRERCEEALREVRVIERTMEQGVLNGAHIKRWNACVDYLTEFIHAETGRVASPTLDQTAPLVMYFPTPEARSEFIKVFKQALSNVRLREMP